MKRAVVGLLCFTLASGLLTGCIGQNGSREVLASSGIDKELQQKFPDENTTELPKDTQAEDTDEKDMSSDLTMKAIKESAGTMDYTSLEGLELEKESHIAVVVKATKAGFWSTVKKGMDAAVKDLNKKLGYKGADKIKLSYEGPSSDTDVESQINIIDAVLAENPDVLCLAAIDMESCQAQLETAKENGIPVVILDSGVSTGTIQTKCATDNYLAGVTAAQKLSEAIGGAGQIAVMAHVESSETSLQREKGFTEEIEKNHPNVSIVNISRETEETSMKDMALDVLKQYPDLKGYYATNEGAASDVLDAIAEMKNETIKVVGFDAGKKQIEAIKSGTETGVIAQNPYGMGYATVVAAARAELGMEIDANIDPGFVWIDAVNLENDEYMNYLYE